MLKKEAGIYIKNRKNLGYAPTMNKGWKASKGDYIVTANNDIEVFKGWQEEFLRIIKEYNADLVGGLGSRDRMIEGMPIENHLQNIGINHNIITEGGRLGGWMFPGGFFIMKRSVLEKLEFDENYIHGGYEDIDYFYRAKLAGMRLIMTS